MRSWIAIGLGPLLVCTVACEGSIKGEPTHPIVEDMGSPSDDAEVDEGPPVADPECVGVVCGANAECLGGTCWCSPGFMGDPNLNCTPGNPCADEVCTFGSTCHEDGVCSCDIGFDESFTYCEFAEVDTPQLRTPIEVCARWNADYPETDAPQWLTEPAHISNPSAGDACDPGELHPAVQLDAVRRVTLYRWLVGLPAVTTTRDYMTRTQACATTLDAHNVGATNNITPEFTCYSETAAAGALGSSILRTSPDDQPVSAANAVDVFMEDKNAPNLGNRRWILNPQMGATAFGHAGDYTCMYAVDRNGAPTVPYFGYPIGTFPIEALHGRWMWASGELNANVRTRVAVLDSNGEALPIANVRDVTDNIDLPSGLSWEVPDVQPGIYTVKLMDLVGEETELSYTVNLVTCP